MKIAVFHELPYGGARRAVLELSNELKKNNKIDLYYIDEKKEPEVNKYFDDVNFIKFLPKEWKGKNWRLKLYKDTIELIKLYNLHKEIAKSIDINNYDLVFVHGSKYSQSPFILRFLKTKSVYYCQEPLRMVYENLFDIPKDLPLVKKIYERFNRNNRRLIDKSNAKKADLILTNSKYTQQNIKKYMGLKSRISYLGINTKVFFTEKVKKKYDLLFVGSREDIDGYSLLNEVIQNMKSKPSVFWLLRENGWITDSELRRIYNQSKIITCLAYKEPFGLLPLEAGACGTVVVAISEGGYIETVRNKATGVLVKRDPIEIANTLSKLLKNEERLKSMSEKAIKYVKDYWTWDKAADRLMENIKTQLF
jgi:glycosyltransferase involved in cell wall biosynthesis